MRFSPLLLLAQAAALSSAFLVPPQISESDLPDLVPIDIGADIAVAEWSMSRILRIPCDGCPYTEKGVDTDLVLDFNLPQGGHKTMNLNGVPVFPLEAIDPTIPLKAVQMPHDVLTIVYAFDHEHFPEVELDNTRMITTDVITDDGAKEYTLELNILGVSGVPVKIQGIQMVVLESPSGELAFGPIRPIPESENCGTNIRCMLNKMMAKLRNIKTHSVWGGKTGGCHGAGRKGKIQNNPVVEGLEGLEIAPAVEGDKPHHGHHHGHHHHGHHGHHARPKYHSTIFRRIVAQVVIPILIGIFAGMAVSLVGMIVAHAFIMLYRKVKGIKTEHHCGQHGFLFGRRRRERRERARLAAMEADGQVEKGLLADEPVLESPPAYADDGMEVVVVDKQ